LQPLVLGSPGRGFMSCYDRDDPSTSYTPPLPHRGLEHTRFARGNLPFATEKDALNSALLAQFVEWRMWRTGLPAAPTQWLKSAAVIGSCGELAGTCGLLRLMFRFLGGCRDRRFRGARLWVFQEGLKGPTRV
jgi:hypothetical protein